MKQLVITTDSDSKVTLEIMEDKKVLESIIVNAWDLNSATHEALDGIDSITEEVK